MDETTLKETVEDVLDDMIATEAFKDTELAIFYAEQVAGAVDLNANDTDQVINRLMDVIQNLLQEAHYRTRGK